MCLSRRHWTHWKCHKKPFIHIKQLNGLHHGQKWSSKEIHPHAPPYLRNKSVHGILMAWSNVCPVLLCGLISVVEQVPPFEPEKASQATLMLKGRVWGAGGRAWWFEDNRSKFWRDLHSGQINLVLFCSVRDKLSLKTRQESQRWYFWCCPTSLCSVSFLFHGPKCLWCEILLK